MVATLIRAEPTSGINLQIAHERAVAQPEAALLADYRAYMRGRQLDPRTKAQRAMFPELEKHAFCDNICRRVVLTPTNRLTIARFDVAGDDEQTARIAAHIDETMTLNRFRALSTAINVATVRDGDHAVALRWEDGATRLIREAWWDGSSGVFQAYDDNDLPTYAVKEWWPETHAGGRVLRRAVWFPDRIERYESVDGSAWAMINLPGDPFQGGQPVPWLTPDGEPLGIMLVHFANQLVPNDGAGGASGLRADSRYGLSLLAGGILGIQDRINLIHFDVIATSSFTGTQMLWATGLRLDVDANGKAIPLEVVPGSFATTSNENAAFGHFPAGSIEAHERALQIQKQAVAEATGLPYVALTGQTPSGEALMHMEAELAEVVDKLGELVGPSYASVMHKSTRLANVFSHEELDEEGKVRLVLADLDESRRITTVFAPAQRINPLALALQLATLVDVEGRREALRDAGKQPGDVQRIIEEVAEDQQARAVVAGAALDSMMNVA